MDAILHVLLVLSLSLTIARIAFSPIAPSAMPLHALNAFPVTHSSTDLAYRFASIDITLLEENASPALRLASLAHLTTALA